MLLSNALFHATAALLLTILFAKTLPPKTSRLARPYGLMALGVAIPLLDLAWAVASQRDPVKRAIMDQPLHGPFYALLLVAAGVFLAAFWAGAAPALEGGLWVMAGWGLHTLLSVATVLGAPLLYPFARDYYALPIHPTGHPALVMWLIFFILLSEGLPWLAHRVGRAALAFVGAYALAGLAVFAYLFAQSGPMSPEGASRFLQPENPWLTQWRVTYTTEEAYMALELNPFSKAPGAWESWSRQMNNRAFAGALNDPVVARFFRERFRHPLVTLQQDETAFTLLMEEKHPSGWSRLGPVFFYQNQVLGERQTYRASGFFFTPVFALDDEG